MKVKKLVKEDTITLNCYYYCCGQLLKDIFDLFGLESNGPVLTRAVTVGLRHHHHQVTVGNLLHNEHPAATHNQIRYR